jgi:hypothetical protein
LLSSFGDEFGIQQLAPTYQLTEKQSQKFKQEFIKLSFEKCE